ncbi:SNF1-related protein kinase regulatory subunit gamma-1-like [Euphorbia lathyris]|uniref:SNF1-related protein kinase regulatory subunit gamma-1-like n=1 Tax=Euphorbia lathyris TaxID=212925 RepID=UPI003313D759
MQHEYGMKVVEDNDGKAHALVKQQQQLDSPTALQIFLDRIPVSCIPSINTCLVVDLKTGDSVKDAIQFLYEKNVCGAIIADNHDNDDDFGRFSQHYMGYIDFPSLLLWSLDQCEKHKDPTTTFLTMLQQNPQIGQTKIGELAKSFLWDPYFPVHLDDTLFHVLLLLSKHPRLEMVPVIHNKSDSKVIGFITQNDVTQLLLRSSGLEWFDGIANKALSEFCFEGQEHMNICVYGDQSLAEGLGVLWESRIGAVAIVNRGNEKIMGCITSNHVLLIFQDNKLFNMRKNLSMKEFIDMEAPKKDSHGLITPQVYSPVTATTSDTLKHAMNQLVKSKANVCFLIDDLKKVMGMVTLRDIIVQFAPPCIDSGFHGGGFFDSALEQTGCQLKNGTIICDH